MGRERGWRIRVASVVLATGGVVLAVPPTAAQAGGAGETVRIEIRATGFEPAQAQAPVDSTVEWHNADTVAHSVVADDGTIDSGPIDPGGTYALVFADEGVLPYHDGIYPDRTATLTIGNPPPATTVPATVAPADTAPPTTAAGPLAFTGHSSLPLALLGGLLLVGGALLWPVRQRFVPVRIAPRRPRPRARTWVPGDDEIRRRR